VPELGHGCGEHVDWAGSLAQFGGNNTIYKQCVVMARTTNRHPNDRREKVHVSLLVQGKDVLAKLRRAGVFAC
jgi:hypothetical protein